MQFGNNLIYKCLYITVLMKESWMNEVFKFIIKFLNIQNIIFVSILEGYRKSFKRNSAKIESIPLTTEEISIKMLKKYSV